jgi:hypothetical protein
MDLDPNPLPCLVADMLGLVARAGTSAEMQMQHSKHALHSTLDIRLDTLTHTHTDTTRTTGPRDWLIYCHLVKVTRALSVN